MELTESKRTELENIIESIFNGFIKTNGLKKTSGLEVTVLQLDKKFSGAEKFLKECEINISYNNQDELESIKAYHQELINKYAKELIDNYIVL